MIPRYKDRRYANRGQPLEDLVKAANKLYRHDGIAVIGKQATEFLPIRDAYGKIINVKVEEKATVDFLGRYKQYPIAIEAKHTSGDSIRFDAVQPHQADYMDDFTSCPGTIGLVVVSFNLERFFVIPWAFWKVAYDTRVRPGATRTARVEAEAFGQNWTVPTKKSVRMEELNPSWEIPNQDYYFGIHYLTNAEKYITPPRP